MIMFLHMCLWHILELDVASKLSKPYFKKDLGVKLNDTLCVTFYGKIKFGFKKKNLHFGVGIY